MKVAFTKFIAPEGQSMCKRVSLDDSIEGGFKKEADKFMDGAFQTIVCDWDAFGSVLAGLSLNECLCYGTSKMREGRGWKKSGECGFNKVRRTLENFGWNAKAHGADAHVVLLDLDQLPEGFDARGSAGAADVELILERMMKDVPELDKVAHGFWAYPSSGAYLSVVGAGAEERENGAGAGTGLSGLHFYMALPVGIDPMAFREYLYNYLICTGKGKIKETRDARLRVQTYIDHSAIGAERVDYIAGAACSEGCRQDRWAPVFIDTEGRGDFVLNENGVWNKRLAASVKEDLKRQYRIAAGAGYEARLEQVVATLAESRRSSVAGVKKSYEMLDRGELLGSELLLFDDAALNVDVAGGGSGARGVYAWRAALLRDKYHGATLADPRDYKQRAGKAKFYANSDGEYSGRPAIHGFKGEPVVFKIAFDLESVQMATAGMTPETMEEAYGSGWWWIASEYAGVDASEESEVMNMLKNRWSKNEKDLRKKISGAVRSVSGKVVKDKLGEALEEYNRKYACVRFGSDVRVLWDEESSLFGQSVTCEMTKTGFFDLKAPDKVWSLDSKGVAKPLSVPKVWFENQDRATFMGTTFDPNTLDRSVKGMFNMWRGWCVESVGCHGAGCGGQGCLKWFLSVGIDMIDLEADPTLVEAEWRTWGCGARVEDGIIWWLRSAYENLSEGNRDHFEWLMGWVANLFQDPARKPGTCVLLRGSQGVGKGQFVKPLEDICKRHFYQATKRRETTGQFNAHLENLLLLFVDESTWGGDRSAAQEWKGLVSEETYGVEKKGRDIIIGKNHARVIVASNEDQPLSIERTDRRHFVLECLDRFREKDDAGNSRGLLRYWRNVAATNRGALLHEMLNFRYETDPRVAPVSVGLQNQKMLGAMPIEKMLVMALDNHPEVFNNRGVTTNYLYWLLADIGRFTEKKHMTQTEMTNSLTNLFARMPEGTAERRKPFNMKAVSPDAPERLRLVKGRGWIINGVLLAGWVKDVFGYESDFEPEI